MNGKQFLALFVLASVWGASFLFMRIAAPEMGPFLTVEIRVLLATIVLFIYALLIGQKLKLKDKWKQFLILGAINAAIPFVFITTAELKITASLASILNATTPLFTALVVWFWQKEPLGAKKLLGLVVGVIGVIILVGWSFNWNEIKDLLYISLSLLAAFSYGVAGTYATRTFSGVSPLEMAIGQQLGASVLLLPFSLATLPDKIPSGTAMLSVAGLAILSTAFAYLLYFFLLHSVGAVKTLSVTFLIPMFGILWGFAFLNEPLSSSTFIGMFVIFISIYLVMSGKKIVQATDSN